MKAAILITGGIALLPVMAAGAVVTLVGMAAYIGARAAIDFATYLAK